VRRGTGRHVDQTARNIHQPALELRPRDLRLQNNRPALIEADQVERVLAASMPIVAMVDGIASRDMGRAPSSC
jgi:hypothetical protein